METKILSLDETRRMLPLLSRIVADITEHWKSIIAKRTELESLQPQSRGEEEENETRTYEIKNELNYLIDKINCYIKEVESLGCFVEEFKRGIINFPTLYHGRKVFLCWCPGEETVSHWHELDETFADRVKIKNPDDFLREKRQVSRQNSGNS